ncbi:MAG: glycosyltransferase family 4 protein [Dysgonomonas sp.]
MLREGNISIILPFKANNPSGGFRILYEYANRLSALGYSVCILYPLGDPYLKYRLPYCIRYVKSLFPNSQKLPWFNLRKEIQTKFVPYISDKYVAGSNIIISSWWSTSLSVGQLSDENVKKINLIQGLENWDGNDAALLNSSYNQVNTTNVVVASYLRDIVKQHTNNETVVINNAIDPSDFFVSNPIENRDPETVCMLYSTQQIKGCEYGIEALKIVKQKYPQLKVDLLGVHPHPQAIPEWMQYHKKPANLPQIYNRNALFISNSLTEGMSLMPLEAMSCGCALLCTDIDGHKEYAVNGQTALMYEPRNVDDLVQKILLLIGNNKMRCELAERGVEISRKFSWTESVEKMDVLIQKLIKK